jgi:two-component system cell cycle sensor histidine kinase/response regulator CckA
VPERRERTPADPAALAARAAPVLLVVCDLEGRGVWANDRWHEVTGTRPGRETAEWTEAVHPEDRAGLLRALQNARADVRNAGIEVRLRSADGAQRWMLCKSQPWCGPGGTPGGIVAACTDVTERREGEASLRRSEELFSRAFQASPAAISISTVAEGKYLYVNERFLQLIGRTRQDVVGRTSVDLAFWGDPRQRQRVIDELSRSGSLRDVAVVIGRPSGERRDALVSLELVELAGQRCLLGLSYDVTERKQAEEAVRKSEERFRALVENSTEAIVLVDRAGGVVYQSPSAFRILGYTTEERLGRNAFELVHPDDLERATATMRACLASTTPQAVEARCRRKDGVWRDLEMVATNHLADPAVQAIIVNYRDVTERRLAEEALRESERRFRAVIENSSDAIALFAADGTILYGSPATTRILGYGLDDFVGRNAFDLIRPEDRDGVRRKLEDLLSRPGTMVEVSSHVRHQDGSWRYLEGVFNNLLDDPSVRAIVNNYRDATERRLAEEELRRSQEWLERAQAVAHVGSWVSATTKTGSLEWSAETLRIFGLAPGSFDGRVETFVSMVHPEDRLAVQQAREEALAGRARYSIDHRIVRADGSVRWVHEEADVLRDEAGRPASMIGTAQDITDRKRLEEQLLQSQKMEAIGRLAGGVAHDFNNLLTAIIGYADLLARRVKGTPRLEHNVAEILEAAERAAGLTRQLLAFSRKQVLQPRVLSLNTTVADIENMLRRLIGEDVQLVTRLHERLGHVRADPTQLEQVILNLAVNARDAMPRGGQLTVETGDVELENERYVMLAVSDTGVGMDAETRSRVFEPFFTTKEPGKGTGLGLAMVYGIVAQSGGSIRVHSEPGKGTTFKVLLPRVDDPLAPDPGPAERPAEGGSETLLVAEDEDGVRSLICEILRELGYHVLEAPRPEVAIKTMRDGAPPVHLLLTDVVMPDMDGRQLAEKLTILQPGLRVLYMSGYTGEAIAEHGVLEHGTHFLQKPFTPDALARKVREVLDQRAGR